MALKLDPRTKLSILFISIIVMALKVNLAIEIIVILIFILPYFLTRRYSWGIGFLVFYSLQLLTAVYLLPYINNPYILYPVSFLTSGLRRMMVSVISGTFAILTTTVSEWIATFKKLNLPNAIIIPFAVICRFFPTVREDYRHIRRAMAFRGIGTDFVDLIKQPLQSFEYILIPLLMNASQVAQDLTVSSLTKGLGMPGRHTSIVNLKMTAVDWTYIIAALTPVLIYLGGNF